MHRLICYLIVVSAGECVENQNRGVFFLLSIHSLSERKWLCVVAAIVAFRQAINFVSTSLCVYTRCLVCVRCFAYHLRQMKFVVVAVAVRSFYSYPCWLDSCWFISFASKRSFHSPRNGYRRDLNVFSCHLLFIAIFFHWFLFC